MIFFDFHHHHFSDIGIYNLDLHEEIPDFKFSAGIHPKDILENFEDQFSWLISVATHKNCVGIGECGLDGLTAVDFDLQKSVFKKQINLANDLHKPVIIHCVQKFHELAAFKKISKTPMIIHGFNKRETIGNQLLSEGFYLSFGASILQNVNLQNFFLKVPLDKFFLETDDHRINIENIYQKAAEIKQISIEKLIEIIEQNLLTIGINI